MRKWLVFACCGIASPAWGALSVQLTAPLSPPPMVGVPIPFTASAADTHPGALSYRFSVSRNGGEPQILVDYNSYSTFTWAPSLSEGLYTVAVSVRNVASGETAVSQIQFPVLSWATAGQPAVTPTAHPLVALYSAPPCPPGKSVSVYFGTGTSLAHTNQKTCGSTSTNFYIAGMLPNTTYDLYYELSDNSPRYSILPIHHLDATERSMVGPHTPFTTGAIPAALDFASSITFVPPTAQSSADQSILLIDELSLISSADSLYYFPTATDLNGDVLWYYDALGNAAQASDYFIRPVAGGTFLLIAADPNTAAVSGQILREIDLAGNTVRETNAGRVSEQLVALGLASITGFDHDAVRLPNGHTIVLASQEQLFSAGTQGSTAPIDILGNAIIDLDQNLQVAWAWSAYDHLDINRAAILGETCMSHRNGCPYVALAPLAADWTHANSLSYIPSSGDLLLSMRHQDWVIKIDYNNGAGSGAVLWELGSGGSFSIVSSDSYPWFSHQHEVEFELNGATTLSLFDNGNTRVARNAGSVENSRGMVLKLDETGMTATPLLSQDLGVYSPAVGSAQRLDNGNYHFEAGYINGGQKAQHTEFSLGGTLNYFAQVNDFCYRSYRMVSLYELNSPGN